MQPNLGQTQPTAHHTPAPRQWFIQVTGQNYGPFDDQTLWQFMCEGRVSAQSLISHAANGSYRPVSADPGLMSWMAQVPAKQAQPVAAAVPQAKPTVMTVMGEIRSGRGMEFLQTLQSLGPVQRVGDTVWLLQARATADTVRNVLCQPLGPNDRLFVLDSFANETAWFNLSPDMDAQIAALWNINRDD